MKRIITVLNKDYIVVPYINNTFRCHADFKKLITGTIEEIKAVIQNTFNVSDKVVPPINQRLNSAVTMMLDATVVQLTEVGKLWLNENNHNVNGEYIIGCINANSSFLLYEDNTFNSINCVPHECVKL